VRGGMLEPIASAQKRAVSHFATRRWMERDDSKASSYFIIILGNERSYCHERAMLWRAFSHRQQVALGRHAQITKGPGEIGESVLNRLHARFAMKVLVFPIRVLSQIF
jgi:hypothetical protein